jgi:hypothetical protein
MDDFDTDLAHDYEWLFPDDTVGNEGKFGATSRGNKDLLETVLETLAPGAQVLDCSDLADAIHSAGFNIKDDSYQPGSPFYAVAATPRRLSQTAELRMSGSEHSRTAPTTSHMRNTGSGRVLSRQAGRGPFRNAGTSMEGLS